jgi:hypothetical protein
LFEAVKSTKKVIFRKKEMTTQQYVKRIYEAGKASNLNVEMEKFALKFPTDKKQVQFRILSLLQNLKQDEVSLNHEIIAKIEKHLNLIFVEEEIESNVCFANSDELRAAFKQSFRLIDLLDYSYAFVHLAIYKQYLTVLVLSDLALFWQMVQKGAVMRKEIV